MNGTSKSHKDYWKARLYKNAYSYNGQKRETSDWIVKIQYKGRREIFNTGTCNQEAAAHRARDIYLSLCAKGWSETLAIFKPDVEKTVKKQNCSVGEFLAEIKIKSGLKLKTFAEYARRFRQLVAEIYEIDGEKSKYDLVNGGHKRWIEKIESIKLADITPEKVQKWKLAYLAKAEQTPLAQKSAKVSVNKIIRNSKALFAPKTLKFIELELPAIKPFDGITFENEGSHRYRSEINLEALLLAGKKELADTNSNQFKILLLGLLAGLRRKEMDLLEWTSIDYADGRIHVVPTNHFQPKTEDSVRSIEVDFEILEILKTYQSQSLSPFVLDSIVPPNVSATYEHYRCAKDFEGLIRWLKKQGINAKNPLHALRKEYGSVINQKAGIFEASRLLGHSSTQITQRHYLDSKVRVTLSVGGLFK